MSHLAGHQHIDSLNCQTQCILNLPSKRHIFFRIISCVVFVFVIRELCSESFGFIAPIVYYSSATHFFYVDKPIDKNGFKIFNNF